MEDAKKVGDEMIYRLMYRLFSRKKRELKGRFKKGLKYLKQTNCPITDEEIRKHHLIMSPNKFTTYENIVRIKTRIWGTIQFIEKDITVDKNTELLDVGDASGVFLRHFGKKGLSINNDLKAVNYLKENGMDAKYGDIHNLSFLRNAAIDYTFCFETIEHTECPLFALKELKRVTRNSIFLSTPNHKRTYVRYPHQGHIFEFSREDWEKVFNRAGLIIRRQELCPPLKYSKFWLVKLESK